MAITSNDIHEQIFTIDRKGYNSDEVDVFLERVAEEIDTLNSRVEELEGELEASYEKESSESMWEAPAAPIAVNDEEYEAKLYEKDAQIASLNSQLEQRRADANAIAQALIVAQRSADTIIADARAQAAQIIEDAQAEQARIVEETEAQRQALIDSINELEDERDEIRDNYQDMLRNFISDATSTIAKIDESKTSYRSAHAANVAAEPKKQTYQAPVNKEQAFDTASFAVAPASSPVVVAATPIPSGVEKDFSGFGDVDDSFEFDDLD